MEQVRARAEMAETEDTKVLDAISTATTTATGKNTIQTSTAGLDRKTLAALFNEVEQHDAPVANIIMHSSQYKDIRGWAKDFGKKSHYPETDNANLTVRGISLIKGQSRWR